MKILTLIGLRKNILFISLLVFNIFAVQVNAQVVTVTNPGNTAPALSATYTTLALAITAVNATTTISGPVTITLNTSNPQTAPVGGYSITAIPTGASATNKITFEGSGNSITAFNPQSSGNINDAIFKLIGADFITIQNFVMIENPLNTTATLASNNMTEFGVALLYASLTNGAQNNTIQNNSITLNKASLNTFGIYSNTRHSATSVSTSAEVTSAAGSNSGNKIYTNTISNVNYGIVFIGAGTTIAAIDNGNDIGGSSISTGNTITNWGGGASLSSYVSLTGSNYCIFNNQQINDNVSYNTITSASLTSSTTTGGILKNYSVASPTSGTITTTINNNILTITNNPSASTTGTVIGINCQGLTPLLATATISINNNTIQNCVVGGSTSTTVGMTCITNASVPGTLNITGNSIINNAISSSTSTSGLIVSITNSGACGTANLNSNIIRSMSSTSTSGQMQGIINSGAIVTALNMNNNQLGNVTSGYFSSSVASSGTLFGISTSAGASTCALSIQNNDIRGITYSVAASSTQALIQNTAATLSQNISTNTFTNLNINTTGSVTFVSNGVSLASSGNTMNINGNSIATAFNKSGAGGTVTFYSTSSSSVTGSIINIQNNNFSNITLTGLTGFTGINNTDGLGAPTKTITGNTFNNISGGTGSITPINVGFLGGTSSISTNTITNISTGSAITALSIGTGTSATVNINANIINNISSSGGSVIGLSSSNANTQNISNNLINTLSSSNTSSSITGISISGAAITTIFKNKIYDLSGSTASSTVNGIAVSTSGTSVNIYNNLIGDLRTPITTITSPGSAIIGINLTSTSTSSTINAYYNSIFLNATSSGTNFATTGIFHTTSSTSTTAALNLRNNLIVNNSTSNGTGLSVAYRRSSTTLTNYSSTSNNNDLFAPVIFSDGTNSDVVFTNYKSRVSTRDALSFSENPTFLSTTGSSSNFLKIDPAISSQIESGAVNIATFTDDFAGTVRFGNAGYVTCPLPLGTAPDIGAWEFCGTPAPSMVYTSSTTVQQTGAACPGTSNIAILRMEVVTTGAASALSLTNLTVNGNGTSNLADIASYRVYYTGTSSTFSTTTAVTNALTGLTSSNVVLTPTSTITLAQGTNYFWLAYTLNTTTTGPNLDGEFTNVALSTGGGNPTVTAPASNATAFVKPVIVVTPNTGLICNPGGTAIPLVASGGTSYSWSPTTNLTPSTGANVSANPSATTTYIVTGTDINGCTNTATALITVGTAVSVSATATPANICSGSNSQLLVTASQIFSTTAPSTYGFVGSTGSYNLITGTTLTTSTTDDNGVGNLPIGFSFNYNGTNHTVFGMRTNGLIELSQTSTSLSGFSSNTLASTANCIAPLWDDNNTVGGTMIYTTTGTSPNRVLIAQWTALHVGGTGSTTNPTIDMQVRLYEGSNKIEFIYGNTSATLLTTTASIGISGASGNYLSVTPLNPVNTSTSSSSSENSTIAAAVNFPTGTIYTFNPGGAPVFTYSWSPTTFIVGQNTLANPLATAVLNTTNYSVVVTGISGCTASASASVSTSPLACSAITSPALICSGTNFTLNSNTTGGGGSNTYLWSDGAGTTTPNLTQNLTAGNYTYTVTVTDLCNATCSQTINLTVNQTPTTIVSPTSSTICNPGGSAVSLTASGTSTSFAWSPASGLSTTTGTTVSANPTSTTTYTVIGSSSSGCTSVATSLVSVGIKPTVTATATPATICSGSNSQLLASAGFPSTSTYSLSTTTYGLTTPVSPSTITLSDDDASSAITLPFSFNFFGNTYSSIYVHSNGFATFTASQPTGAPRNESIPTAATPNNYIAICHDDLNVTGGGVVSYFSVGTTPNRIFIIDWNAVKFYNSASNNGNMSGQIKMYELDNHIEVHVTSSDDPSPSAHAIGIENATGIVGYPATGRNNVTYSFTSSTPEAWIFQPNGLPLSGGVFTYAWSPSTFIVGQQTLANPLATAVTTGTTYTVIATEASGCTASTTTAVSINSTPVSCGTITTSATKCTGSNFTVSIANPTGDIAPYTYTWSDGSVTSYPNTQSITANLTSGTYLFTCTVTGSCGTSCSSTLSVTVNGLPTLSTTASASTYCTPGVSIQLAASGTSTTYLWSPSTGLSATTGATVFATPTSATVYSVIGTDANGCTNTSTLASIAVVATPQFVTATATPAIICGGTSNLTSSAYLQNTTSAAKNYTFSGSSGTYNVITGTSAGASAIGNDVGVGNLPIGFTFNYNGSPQTVFAVSSNGMIQLGNTSATISGFATNSLNGNALVLAPLWDDNNTTGGTVVYSTTGSIGSRVLTVQWGAMHVGGTGSSTSSTINMQVQLFEGTGIIKFNYGTTSAVLASTNASIGISGGLTQYISVTPLSPASSSTSTTASENSTISSATNFPTGTTYTFTPPSAAVSYSWSPAGDVVSPSTQNTATNTLSTTETFTVTASNGVCNASANTTVTVSPVTCNPATVSSPLCAGSTTTITANPIGDVANFTYVWNDGLGGSYPTTRIITANLPAGTYTFTCTVTSSCGNVCTSSVSFTVNALPTITATSSSSIYCIPGSAIQLNAGGGVSYAWSPAAGLSATTGSTVLASPTSTTTYSVIGTSASGCTNTATLAAITIGASPQNVTATSSSSAICSGTATNLSSTAYAQNTVSLANTYSFTGSTGTYSTITGTSVGSGVIGDDVGVGNLPIGFTFNYNGTPQTVFAVSSNGIIQLGNTSATITGFADNLLASTSNIIAPLWDDNNTTGSSVIYSTTGSAGSRVLTIQWTSMHVGGTGAAANPTINLQVQLFETTGIIKINYGTTSAALSSTTASIGISGAIGNYISVTPLSPVNTSSSSIVVENTSIASATNFPTGTIYTFTPPSLAITYAWTPSLNVVNSTSQNTATNNLSANTTFTIFATNNGCTTQASTSVAAAPLTCAVATVSAIRCSNKNFTITANATGDIGPYTYSWSDGTANVYPSTQTITVNLAAGNFTFTCTVSSGTCGTSCSSSATFTVNPLPTLTVNPTTATYCTPGSAISITASGSSTTYSWAPSSGLSGTTGATVSASPTNATTYTVTGTDVNSCTNTATSIINVGTTVTAIASASPATICSGSNSQLTSTVNPYSVTPITYSSTSTTGFTNGPIGDDVISSPILLPFSFNFYGNSYSSIYINTNGQVGFSDYALATDAQIRTAQTLPNPSIPNNTISLCWVDLEAFSGDIKYGTSGTAPNRIFVISYSGVPFFASGGSVSGQIKLFETSNKIQIHVSNVSTNTELKTLGIENANGTLGVSPSTRNNLNWLVGPNEAWEFNTTQTFTYAWSPTTFISGQQTSANPLATAVTSTTPYTLTVTSSSGCTATASTTVNVFTTPTASISGTTSICTGGSTNLTLNFTGTAPWTYSINGASPVSTSTNPLTVAVTPTTSTTYSLTSFSDASCTGTVSGSAVITLNPLPQPVLNYTTDQTICTTDEIFFSVSDAGAYSGGYPPGTLVDWSGTILNQTPSTQISSNSLTSFYATIKLGNGCTTATSSTVNVSVLTVGIITSSTQEACSSANGSVTTTATGIGPFRFKYTSDLAGTNIIHDVTSSSNTNTYSGLSAGTYYVTVTGNYGSGNNPLIPSCNSETKTVVVSVEPPIVAHSGSNNETCPNANNGNVTVAPTGGSGSYSYLWTPGLYTTAFVSNLSPGTYSYLITDNITNCTISGAVTINPAPSATYTQTINNVTCGAISDGSISVDFSASPVTVNYEWLDNTQNAIFPAFDDADLTGQPAGIYYLHFIQQDANSCEAIVGPFTIIEHQLPTAIISGGGAICAGGILPNVNIAFTGIGPWTVIYLNGVTPTTITTSLNPYTINTASVGIYSLSTVNDINCSGTFSGSATVSVIPNQTWYADTDNDNYGNPSSSISTCIQPLNYVANNTDCNDGVFTINPSVAEVCGNSIDDNCNTQIDEGCITSITFNLKIFIQGFYDSGSHLMVPTLFNAGVSIDPNECDSIMIDLYDPLNLSSAYLSTTAVLHIDGTASMQLPVIVSGNSYYIVVRHRNSIETWSKNPILFTGSPVTFDFTTP